MGNVSTSTTARCNECGEYDDQVSYCRECNFYYHKDLCHSFELCNQLTVCMNGVYPVHSLQKTFIAYYRVTTASAYNVRPYKCYERLVNEWSRNTGNHISESKYSWSSGKNNYSDIDRLITECIPNTVIVVPAVWQFSTLVSDAKVLLKSLHSVGGVVYSIKENINSKENYKEFLRLVDEGEVHSTHMRRISATRRGTELKEKKTKTPRKLNRGMMRVTEKVRSGKI